MVGKAEYLSKGPNPRFVVTSLSRRRAGARRLHEKLYCARGDMENRIKEQQLGLFADRTSSATMRANQLRLYFASLAYVLMHGLRRPGLSAKECVTGFQSHQPVRGLVASGVSTLPHPRGPPSRPAGEHGHPASEKREPGARYAPVHEQKRRSVLRPVIAAAT